MTDNEFIELLRAHDDPRRAEAPSGFDRIQAESDYQAFAEALSDSLGVSCESETGARIQDASHHGDLRLPESLLVEPHACGVRVSNFGRLCCVYDSESVVRPKALQTIRRVAAAHGYIFVPTRVLEMPYDGRNPGVSGFHTWGDRFFDYI